MPLAAECPSAARGICSSPISDHMSQKDVRSQIGYLNKESNLDVRSQIGQPPK